MLYKAMRASASVILAKPCGSLLLESLCPLFVYIIGEPIAIGGGITRTPPLSIPSQYRMRYTFDS